MSTKTYLGRQICADKLTLVQAREQIARWPEIYAELQVKKEK